MKFINKEVKYTRVVLKSGWYVPQYSYGLLWRNFYDRFGVKTCFDMEDAKNFLFRKDLLDYEDLY